MPDVALALGTAAWLGILTSISPCPLATNIAAVAFVGREGGSPRRALAAGLLYALGRGVAYVSIAAVAVFAVGKLLSVSSFLQGTFYKLLGPLLILVGMVLIGLIDLRLPRGPSLAPSTVKKGGLWAAPALGALFALSFCPVSAAIFFGTLIPLAAKQQSVFVVPAVYGLATGLPVALFAFAIALGATRVTAAFNSTARLERLVRPATAVVFILVGIYESLRSIFHVL